MIENCNFEGASLEIEKSKSIKATLPWLKILFLYFLHDVFTMSYNHLLDTQMDTFTQNPIDILWSFKGWTRDMAKW